MRVVDPPRAITEEGLRLAISELRHELSEWTRGLVANIEKRLGDIEKVERASEASGRTTRRIRAEFVTVLSLLVSLLALFVAAFK